MPLNKETNQPTMFQCFSHYPVGTLSYKNFEDDLTPISQTIKLRQIRYAEHNCDESDVHMDIL